MWTWHETATVVEDDTWTVTHQILRGMMVQMLMDMPQFTLLKDETIPGRRIAISLLKGPNLIRVASKVCAKV
jgi:hypothetical protein